MLERYEGKVKLVFKNFPLRKHRYAVDAAIAALAAGKQGKFWPFHDRLYKNYNRLSNERIEQISRELGLDMERFERDKEDMAIKRLISRDVTEGVKIGVRGTPTIFINGRRLRNRSFEGFQAAIERALESGSGSR